uniref:Uncharacterized protein n=1 Tax=Panagrolaimus sp. JU765 TaxID=591449 RepID=A0AC34RIU5_9BILA
MLYNSSTLFGRECEAGWGYDANYGRFYLNVLDKDKNYVKDTNCSTVDFNVDSRKYAADLLCELFGNCKDFVEAIAMNNQNACSLVEFLMKNRETTGFISCLTHRWWLSAAEKAKSYSSDVTHYVKEVCFGMRFLIIINEKNADLLGNGDKKKILDRIWKKEQNLTENQKNIFCSILALTQDSIKIKTLTMADICKMIPSNDQLMKLSDESFFPISCKMAKLPDRSGRYLEIDDQRWNIVANQIFEVYWLKKILENEIEATFLKQLSGFSLQKAVDFKKEKEKLDDLLQRITIVWNKIIDVCKSTMRGNTTVCELWTTFPIEELIELKNEITLIVDKRLTSPLSASDPDNLAS